MNICQIIHTLPISPHQECSYPARAGARPVRADPLHRGAAPEAVERNPRQAALQADEGGPRHIQRMEVSTI